MAQLPEDRVHMSTPVTRVQSNGEIDAAGRDTGSIWSSPRMECEASAVERCGQTHRHRAGRASPRGTWIVDRPLTDGFGAQ